MSAILNGFYFLCAYTQKTCLQPNDAGAGSPLYAWEYSGNTEQKWYITESTVPGRYMIQNLRYSTYLTWPGGDPTGAVPQNIIQTTKAISWYVNEVQTSGTSSYILISPDTSFQGTWNVMGGSATNNTPVSVLVIA
ncbi:hypothetical protein BJ912DRAFT_963630 [Pholiota molesta]|nr:hypothetical protein BJ912DRAFT_963630 [Pholiota molesta]